MEGYSDCFFAGVWVPQRCAVFMGDGQEVTFEVEKGDAQQPTLLRALKKRRCQFFEELRLEMVDHF